MSQILIAVPCYNCHQQAVRVAKNLDAFFSAHPRFPVAAVVFIDNCSTDTTVRDLCGLFPQLKNASLFQLHENEKNVGLGGSQKKAFQKLFASACDFLVVLHGDNQADVNDLSTLWNASQQNQFSTVLGSRFMDHRKLKGYSSLRTIGNRALNAVYSLVLGKPIYDLGSGLNLFAKADFINDESLFEFDDGFTFNMDLLIYLSQKRSQLLFVPISWKSEDERSNASTWRVGWITLKKIISWAWKHA